MLNCKWAHALTSYECRPVRDLHGGDAIEIGTPFSLPGGAAIVLYLVNNGSHIAITDNGDTLAHLSSMGIDTSNHQRRKALAERAAAHGVTLTEAGDLKCLATAECASFVFAKAVSGVLAVADWTAAQLATPVVERDLAEEAEPFIVARNPGLIFKRGQLVKGASRTEYRFDMRHGDDLIDVIHPVAQATGGAMRKAGDVQNGPFAEGLSPLIVVDDRTEPVKAAQEISILGSVTRAMPFSRLMVGGGRVSPGQIH